MTEAVAVALVRARHIGPWVSIGAGGVAVAAFGVRPVLGAILDVQPFVSAALGLAIVCYIVHRLLCCAGSYTMPERFGMGMTAAGMVMATPALWMPDTPFDGWSFNVARFGIALYVITGGLRRDRHDAHNRNQKAFYLGFREGRAAAMKEKP